MKVNETSHHTGKLLVVGSTNTDMVIKTSHFPQPGETVIGGRFFMSPGGKGANQAVAAARLGVPVTFVCKTGNDIFGHQSQQLFEEEGIDTSYIFSDLKTPSGVALITVDDKAENCIVVASGANANLSPADLATAIDAVKTADLILMQLEIPIETVEFVMNEAEKYNKRVILNPAPARELSPDLLRKLYLLTPNKSEAEMLSGIKITNPESAQQAAEKLHKIGVKNVVLTLGSEGAMVFNGANFELIPAYKVEAFDTTAAGDVFNGALSVAILERKEIAEAVRFACKAAAVSVTRQGAQDSAPYRNEIF